MELHDVQHDLTTISWCGPAALSAVTGKKTSQIHRVVKKLYFKRYGHKRVPVQGMYESEVVQVLCHYGYEVEVIYPGMRPKDRPTLGQFLDNRSIKMSNSTIIISSGSHFIAVHGGVYVDSASKVKKTVEHAPHQKSRVNCVIRITKKTKKKQPRAVAHLSPVAQMAA